MQILENRSLTLQQVVLAGHQQLEGAQQIVQALLEEGAILVAVQVGEQDARPNDELHDVRQVLGRLEQPDLDLLLLRRLVGWVLRSPVDAIPNVNLDHVQQFPGQQQQTRMG